MPVEDDSRPAAWRPLTRLDDARIIKLAPGQGDEALSCSILEITLDDLQEEYIAISYAWGGSELTHVITCGNHLVHITGNLHSALQRARQASAATNVWCDALSIKQGHDPAALLERNHQISLMSRIFSSAVRVVVDLGDDDGTFEQAHIGINTILAASEDLRTEVASHSDPLTVLGLPSFTDPMWNALFRLFSRGYYHRLWTVQEIVLAHDVRVTYGAYHVSLDDLVSVGRVYYFTAFYAADKDQTIIYDIFAFNRPLRAILCLIMTWKKRRARLSPSESEPVSLCDLLISTMSLQCTDLRDRIYALYGMVGEEICHDLPVSYTESVDDLSLRASLYLLKRGHIGWTLVHTGGISTRPGRPSWALDLTTLGAKDAYDPLTTMTEAGGHNDLYTAGGTSPPTIQPDPTGRSLTVRGVLIDTFASMPSEFAVNLPTDSIAGLGGDAKGTAQYTLHHLTTLRAAVTWARATSPHSDDAVWRTLIADCNPHEDDPHRYATGRAQPGFEKYFQELVAWIDGLLDAERPYDVEDVSVENVARLHVPHGANKYWVAITAPYMGRRIVRTAGGRLALVPQGSEIGDVVAVLVGVAVPFVLRRGRDGKVKVVGICYVHGLMDGEALLATGDGAGDGEREIALEDIVLV